MEIYGVDATMHTLGEIKCIVIQWNRRYYEAGDFAIQVRAQDYNSDIAYVYTPERPEIGMVDKIETEHNVKGDFVNVSGFFLEGMFNWKVVMAKYVIDGNVADGCRALMTTYLNLLGNLSVTIPSGTIGESDSCAVEGGERLGDATYGLLKLQELSQRLVCDCDTLSLTYEIWQGVDRTQSQSVNSYASFSQDNGTIDSLTLTTDKSDYYNCAHIVYGNDVHTEVMNYEDVNDPRRWMYILSDLVEDDYPTTAKFEAAVKAAALVELQKHANIVNIDAEILQNNLKYRVDYDLGDKCDVKDSKTGLAFETRIIEVNEVWKQNTHTVALQFGDKIPMK